MKKVVIAIAAVAIGIVANAATYSWATYTGQYVYKAGTTTKLASTAVYLFDSTTVAQATLIAGILDDGKALTDFTSLSSTTTSSAGAIAKKEFDAGDSVSIYFAAISGDDVYVSSLLTGTGSDVGTTALSFKGVSNASKATAIEWTTGSTSVATAGGWYTAVPEPTSGLLMLLGMAGLALKRKRA